MKRSIWRHLLCWLDWCETFKTNSDAMGVWGECQKCGKCVGYTSREELRRYADREINQLIARRTRRPY